MATPNQTIINRIFIRADAQSSDSPKNAETAKEISLKSHDDIDFALELTNGGNPIAAEAIGRIGIEIFDIGARNAPSPREVKLLFAKSSASISAISDANIHHATISLSAEENAFTSGAKWLRVCAFSPAGKRTTFAQGWINVEESFGDAPDTPQESIETFLKTDDAKGIFLQKGNNFSDLLDAAQARENLAVMSATETSAAIENACSQKADSTHTHSQYLESAAAQTLYAKAAETAADISAVSAKANANEGAIASTANLAMTLDSEFKNFALTKNNNSQLHFNNGLLGCAGFAGKTLKLPMSVAVTYDVADWTGLCSGTGNGIMFMGTRGVVFSTPPQYLGFYLAYSEDKKLTFHCANADATPLSAEFEVYTTNGGEGLPTGKHTIVACVGSSLTSGRPSLKLYLDGVPLTYSVALSNMTSTDITSDRQLTVGQAQNYANPTSQACKIPIKLSRARLFNFDMSADSAPYTVTDYSGGKPVPPIKASLWYEQASFPLASYTIGKYSIGTANASLQNDGDYLEMSAITAGETENAYPIISAVIALQNRIPAGTEIRFSYDDWIMPDIWVHNATYGHCSFNIIYSDNTSTIVNDNTDAKEISIIAQKEVVSIWIRPSGSRFTDSTRRSLAIGEVFWKIKGCKIFANGAILSLTDSANAAQVRDNSGNALHAAIVGNVAADKVCNPALCNFALAWTSGQSNGVYCGGASGVLALPANCLCKLSIKGDNATAANFKVGGSTSATQFSSGVSVSSASWATLEITTGASASALYLTPSAALSAATNLNVILEIKTIF